MFCNSLDYKYKYSKKELLDLIKEYEFKLIELEIRKIELIKQNKFNNLKDFYLEHKEEYEEMINHFKNKLKGI